jgi:predicted MFS family arabinose efflux permease
MDKAESFGGSSGSGAAIDSLIIASPASLRALDWFAFFLGDVRVGFGPFVSVYLTSVGWTQTDIGLVLTVGGLVALGGQLPGGAIVDVVRSERTAAAYAVAAVGASALLLAIWPRLAMVLIATVLYAGANCVLVPAIPAISLGLVGYSAMSERLARNARFASIGHALAAVGMGAIGYLVSTQFVFFLTAALIVPTLIALFQIRASEIDPARAHGAVAVPHSGDRPISLISLLAIRPLLVLEAGVLLFHLANTPILPLIGGILASRFAIWATMIIASLVVASQLVIAAISPWIGRKAQMWGRRPLFLASFAVLAARAGLLAVVSDPYLLIVLQILDGVSAAIFGTIVPLIIADITRGTGHFNLALGVVGTALGVGASISTLLAGYVSDRFGSETAFLALAATAAVAFVIMWIGIPETRCDALPVDA